MLFPVSYSLDISTTPAPKQTSSCSPSINLQRYIITFYIHLLYLSTVRYVVRIPSKLALQMYKSYTKSLINARDVNYLLKNQTGTDLFSLSTMYNYDVAVDVIFINIIPMLHAVWRQIHFSRAIPLPKQDSNTLWMAFMTIWVTPYLGVPYNLWVYQAKYFMSVQFKDLASSLGCNLITISVEVHWSLISETYHDPLRHISKKFSFTIHLHL